MPFLAIASTQGKCIVEVKRGDSASVDEAMKAHPNGICRTFPSKEEAERFLYPVVLAPTLPATPIPTVTPLIDGSLAYLTVVEGAYRIMLTDSLGKTSILAGGAEGAEGTGAPNTADKMGSYLKGIKRLVDSVEGPLFVYVDYGPVIDLIQKTKDLALPYEEMLVAVRQRTNIKLKEVSESHRLIQYLRK